MGRATALALAARGAQVMAVARTESELLSLAAEAPVEIFVESVSTEEGCRRIVDAARRLGPISILVNNAGVGSYHERPSGSSSPRSGGTRWRSTSKVRSTSRGSQPRTWSKSAGGES